MDMHFISALILVCAHLRGVQNQQYLNQLIDWLPLLPPVLNEFLAFRAAPDLEVVEA
jgi:hypothetical protein